MSTATEEWVVCDECENKIAPVYDSIEEPYIELPDDHFGDPQGIWIGVDGLNHMLWFDGEHFCSFKCFNKWMRRKIRELKRDAEAESGG